MPANRETQTLFSEIEGAALAKTALAGVGTGLIIRAVALEGYAHEDLAHANLKYHPLIASVSRFSLSLCGMSANRFALQHRAHHRAEPTPPVEKITEAVTAVLEAAGSGSTIPDPGDDVVQFWNSDPTLDPLLVDDGNTVTLRTRPWHEEIVGRNHFTSLLGPLVGLAITAPISRALGSKSPLKTSAIFVSSTVISMGAKHAVQSFTETRAGMSKGGGAVTQNLKGITRKMAERHTLHHETPWDHRAGAPLCKKVGIGIALKMGLARETGIV